MKEAERDREGGGKVVEYNQERSIYMKGGGGESLSKRKENSTTSDTREKPNVVKAECRSPGFCN